MYPLVITIAVLSALLIGAAWLSRKQLERLIFYVSAYVLKTDVLTKVSLITPVDHYTFMNANGDLVSYILLRGARRLIGTNEFNDLSRAISDELTSKMRDGTGKQHQFSFSYLSDPQGSRQIVDHLLAPSIATAQRMGASAHSKVWFEEKAKLLDKLCNDEVVLMSVTTLRAGCLSKADNERYAEWLKDLRAKVHNSLKEQGVTLSEITNNDYAQPILPVYHALSSRHDAVVDSLIGRLARLQTGLSKQSKSGQESTSDSLMGIHAEKLHVAKAVYFAKRFMSGCQLPLNWRPRFIDTPNGGISKLRVPGDLAHVLPLPIARQIFSESIDEVFSNIEYVKTEGLYFASLKMDVFATQAPAPSFNDLVLAIGKDFPFTYTVDILPDGLSQRAMEQMFAGFLGGFGQHNRLVKEAWIELKERSGRGQYIAAQRAIFTTWAKSEDELNNNLSFLKMCVQGWGGITVSNQSGAPVDLYVSSFASLSRANPAPVIPAPMDAIARQVPIYRTASPWDSGQLLLRTESGLPYPVMFGSTKQSAWGTLIFAPPGRGKSFLMNTLNAGLFFSAGIRDLPYITIIDKGMSSANVIEMAKGLLPRERRHQAVSIRLRNTKEYAINIFDTQLGLDFPTEREKDSQVNILSALCVGLGSIAGEFITQVVDEAFRMFNRDSLTAKNWQRTLDSEITEKLELYGMDVSDDNNMPRVWQVVDFLFDKGEINLAARAQRFAVPQLTDLIAAANRTVIRDLYKNATTAQGESVISVFCRSITTAAKEYALLSGYTRFDIGDARVIAVDLEEVLASTGSEEGARRAALMMMFARQLGAKNYFLKWEDEMEHLVPERYKKYHESRIKVMFETLKFLQYDEFHNANGMDDVVREVKTDFREGRKYNVVPLLSSQLFTDFDEELVDVANNFFVLGVGSEKAAAYVQQVFQLSHSERHAITNKCLGPTAKGAPLLGIFKTNDGLVSELLYNSASAMEQWAFNSSAVDSQMRREVTHNLDGNYWLALKGLAHYFPQGTVRHEIERMRLEATSEGADEDGYVAMFARSIAARIKAELGGIH